MAIYPNRIDPHLSERIYDLLAERVSKADVITNAPALIYVYDLKDRKSVFQNRPLNELLGYGASEEFTRDSTWRELMHPEDQQRFPAYVDRMAELRENETSTFEYRMKHADGTWHTLISRDALIPNEDSRFIVGTATDVTEQKRVETRISEQARLLDLSNDAIIMRNIDGTITYWSHGAEKVYGWTPEEAIGKNIHTLLQTQAPGGMALVLAQLLQDGHWTGELDQVRKDGSPISALCRKVLDRDPEGKPIAVLESCNDVSERKQMFDELELRVRERTAELEKANEEMKSFTYTIAHDLRAPLRAIVSNSAILLEELGNNLKPEHQFCLQRQVQNANKMATLIDELLKFSRLARQGLFRTKFSLSDVAADVASDLAIAEPSYNRFRVQKDMIVHADQPLVRVLLFNLMENAAKFSPAGGEISVGTDDGHTFYVRDPGVGFNMAYASKVFLPFERLVMDYEFPGTGIGMASAQRIVHRHSGKIDVESEPGVGTTFYFTLEPNAHDSSVKSAGPEDNATLI